MTDGKAFPAGTSARGLPLAGVFLYDCGEPNACLEETAGLPLSAQAMQSAHLFNRRLMFLAEFCCDLSNSAVV